MIAGITGTQNGMTQRQNEALEQLFRWLPLAAIRHGDCIGVDSEAHDLFFKVHPLGAAYIHPPIDSIKRDFRCGPSVYCVTSPLPYLQRNKYIAGRVAGFPVDLLIAVPKERREIIRSGTWATVRYARSVGTPIIILLP